MCEEASRPCCRSQPVPVMGVTQPKPREGQQWLQVGGDSVLQHVLGRKMRKFTKIHLSHRILGAFQLQAPQPPANQQATYSKPEFSSSPWTVLFFWSVCLELDQSEGFSFVSVHKSQ